jgi:hypothetical protein
MISYKYQFEQTNQQTLSMVRNTLYVITLVSCLVIWLAPILIAIAFANPWYILLYAVWWIPASLFSSLIISVAEVLADL